MNSREMRRFKSYKYGIGNPGAQRVCCVRVRIILPRGSLFFRILEKEMQEKHDKAHAEEMAELEKKHPGALERRKACEEKRAAVKKHELQLMQHRHDESFHGMQVPGKLKADSFWKNNRAQILADTHEDQQMEKLRSKLKAEGKM